MLKKSTFIGGVPIVVFTCVVDPTCSGLQSMDRMEMWVLPSWTGIVVGHETKAIHMWSQFIEIRLTKERSKQRGNKSYLCR